MFKQLYLFLKLLLTQQMCFGMELLLWNIFYRNLIINDPS